LTASYAKYLDINWHNGTGLTNVLSLFYASWGLSPVFFKNILNSYFWYFLNYSVIFVELLIGLVVLFQVKHLTRIAAYIGIFFHLSLGLFMDVGLLGILMCIVWIGVLDLNDVKKIESSNYQNDSKCKVVKNIYSLLVFSYISFYFLVSVFFQNYQNLILKFPFPMHFYFGMYTGYESNPTHSRWVIYLNDDFITENYTIAKNTRIYPEDLLYGQVNAIPQAPLSTFSISQLQGGRATFWGRLFLSQLIQTDYFKYVVKNRIQKPISFSVGWEKYYSYPLRPIK
jgi:hypothetical protein